MNLFIFNHHRVCRPESEFTNIFPIFKSFHLFFRFLRHLELIFMADFVLSILTATFG